MGIAEALTLQLEELEPGTRFPAAPEPASLCITFNGRSYGYRGYRYDRFAEAVDYARLDRARAFADTDADDTAPLVRLPVPSEAERRLMLAHSITFADGVFHWREYRYERLADAIAYVRQAETS